MESAESCLAARSAETTESPCVLVVDDCEPNRELLKRLLEREGIAVHTAPDGDAGWRLFQSRPFDLVVTDLQMPKVDGIGLCRRIRAARSPEARAPIFMITAFGTLSEAAAAGRAGVTDCFLLDDEGLEALLARVRSLVRAERPPTPCELLGASPAIAAARERIESVAELETPVLITGEPGTRHAVAASHLHARSRLAREPFRLIPCSTERRAPRDSEPGTWFLEEIQDLAPDDQLAWHEAILADEEGRAAHRTRVIASTTWDLRVLAARKQFSPELARDLCNFEIWLPPLRERREDLPKLIELLLERVCERIGRPRLSLSGRAAERLCGCAWWGNFPELEDALQSLAAFAPDLEITDEQAQLVLSDSDPIARAARERMRSEREQLLRVLEECGGNFTRMAERLAVDRGTIRYRLRKYGILPRGVGRHGG